MKEYQFVKSYGKFKKGDKAKLSAHLAGVLSRKKVVKVAVENEE